MVDSRTDLEPPGAESRSSGTADSRIGVWLWAARPKTLLAAFAPVLIGTAMAYHDGVAHAGAAACALIGALFIQIGTNFYNDYADFKKGADTSSRLGPLRVTQAGLVSEGQIKAATIIAFALAVLAGAYLMWRGGLPIVIIGVLSIVSGILYTAGRFSLAYVGVADLFVLVFFGPVAVGGTYYVQALDITTAVLVAGIAPGLLATAILLVNNIRDVDQDRAADKRTLVVRFGRPFGEAMYVACIAIAAAVPVLLFFRFGAPPAVLLALLILPLALPAVRRVRSDTGVGLNPVLATTARLLMVYSVLFAVGWAFTPTINGV